jgi:hypothetical protein
MDAKVTRELVSQHPVLLGPLLSNEGFESLTKQLLVALGPSLDDV